MVLLVMLRWSCLRGGVRGKGGFEGHGLLLRVGLRGVARSGMLELLSVLLVVSYRRTLLRGSILLLRKGQ